MDSACGSMVFHHQVFRFFRAERGKSETGHEKHRSAEGLKRRLRKSYHYG
jgi:hypothetical protein